MYFGPTNSWYPFDEEYDGVAEPEFGEKPEPDCPRCERKTAPEHVVACQEAMAWSCKCWWCEYEWLQADSK